MLNAILHAAVLDFAGQFWVLVVEDAAEYGQSPFEASQ